jgi:hypothetical protein
VPAFSKGKIDYRTGESASPVTRLQLSASNHSLYSARLEAISTRSDRESFVALLAAGGSKLPASRDAEYRNERATPDF